MEKISYKWIQVEVSVVTCRLKNTVSGAFSRDSTLHPTGLICHSCGHDNSFNHIVGAHINGLKTFWYNAVWGTGFAMFHLQSFALCRPVAR